MKANQIGVSGSSLNAQAYTQRIVQALVSLPDGENALEVVVGSGSQQNNVVRKVQVAIDLAKQFMDKTGADSNQFKITVTTTHKPVNAQRDKITYGLTSTRRHPKDPE